MGIKFLFKSSLYTFETLLCPAGCKGRLLILFFYQQLTDADQELYKNFPLVISERWQSEVAETVFETINQEADRTEMKKKNKQKQRFDTDEKGNLPAVLV